MKFIGKILKKHAPKNLAKINPWMYITYFLWEEIARPIEDVNQIENDGVISPEKEESCTGNFLPLIHNSFYPKQKYDWKYSGKKSAVFRSNHLFSEIFGKPKMK